MIDKRIKQGLVFAVIILFVSVSFQPVFAVENQTSVNSNQNKKNKSYVDPNIHLTRTNLPILKRSFNYFRNSNYYDAEIGKVMEQIIKRIESKGSVNNEDVENILINNDISSIRIHAFCYIGGEGYGVAVAYPLAFLEILLLLMTVWGWTFFIGIGGFLSFDAYGSIRVGFKTYSYIRNGYAFGYFGGGIIDDFSFPSGYGEPHLRFFPGFALIAFVQT